MAESSLPQDDSGSFAAGSEITFDLVCYPCDNAGEIAEAVGYCTDCREHMCVTCLKCHSKTSLTKHHELVGKDNMPGKQVPSRFSDICTQRCEVHKDDVIKYYCTTHKTLGCGVCMCSNHDTCEGKIHIPDEAKRLSDNKELKEFQQTMASLIEKSDIIIKSSKSYIKYASDCKLTTLNDIKTFRQEINETLDELTCVLIEQVEEDVEDVEAAMMAIADDTSKVQAELNRISSEMDTLLSKKQQCQMFIEMKTSEAKLAEFQHQLEEAETSCIAVFKFEPCEDLRELVRRENALGKLTMLDLRESTATHVTDITVKSAGNTTSCKINGASLLCQDKLVLADSNNATVKLIDTTREQILSEYKPETTPSDVTAISSTQVAVTLPDAKKIIFLGAEDTLSIDREFRVHQPCRYISSMDDKLVVSFSGDPPSVGLLNMEGELLQTISSWRGGQLFSSAPGVTVSPFSRAIYASDMNDDKVVMLDLDGNVMAEYKDDDLKFPMYGAVDELDIVYVCGLNNVHLLLPDCSKVKVLLTKEDGINWPRSICYCKDTGRFYVGMSDNDIIKVFQIE